MRFLILLILLIVSQLPTGCGGDRKQLADIRFKAEKGDAESQFDLGRALYRGDYGVAEDYAEAVKWYRKAAEQNKAKAQFNLGLCYAKGEGVAKDYVEGQKLTRDFKAALGAPAGSESSSAAIAQTRPESSGTRFFMTEDGYLITNEHVAGNGAQVLVY